MRVCLICVEIFAWGKYGGFGRATRTIGRELARRGIDVVAVVPQRKGQRPVEQLDGMKVLAFPQRRPWKARRLLAECNADIYHSCEPSLSTYFAQQAMPAKAHMVTLRDTRDLADWWLEFQLPSMGRTQVLGNFIYEDNWLVRRAVRRADAVFCAAELLVVKGREHYRLADTPGFLPTPVAMPERCEKSEQPMVCFVGRLDRRKRPALFTGLASEFPAVKFVALGSSRDARWEQQLREEYRDLQNLEMPGFVDQFNSAELSETLGRSWILINTSTREGLPNAFIEAAAHGCAILSSVDPDGFASRFGHRVCDDQFADGLRELMDGNRWRLLGKAARKFVADTFDLSRSVDLHIRHYADLVQRRRDRS